MLRSINIKSLSVAISTLVLSTSVNAATLLIDGNGALTGAENVNVSGSLYNVSFQDGSCNSLFNGCTEFTFTDFTSVNAAGQALLDQVFIGIYDTSPEKTNGVEDTFEGWILTPYGYPNGIDNEVATGYIINYDAVDWDGGPRTLSRTFDDDLTSNSRLAYAVWTEASVVPVPAAVWLFGSGLLGLIGVARRKK